MVLVSESGNESLVSYEKQADCSQRELNDTFIEILQPRGWIATIQKNVTK